jgi:hypothetical protein
MAFARQESNGKWVICRRLQYDTKTGTAKYLTGYRDWWLVKTFAKGDYGLVAIKHIVLPKYFVGKRIRLVIEEVK